jgi:hypothetical protein
MPDVRFEPRVSYRNELLLPLNLYPAFRVPPGITVHAPIFVSAQQMQRLAPADTIKVVAGLTKTEFSLRFPDFVKQWRQVRSGSAARWQFQGGVVGLDAAITLYMAEGFQQDPRIFAMIMEHELLHVRDEVDLITRYAPAEARRDQYVQRYLIDGREVDDSMFQTWFRGKGFEQWIHDGIWAPEHNRRGRARDSGTEWDRYRENIDKFMRSPG